MSRFQNSSNAGPASLQSARSGRLPGMWRGPLVLDEFPHLVASAPSLPSVLQNWVDQELVDEAPL
jgi:hypothetical protein